MRRSLRKIGPAEEAPVKVTPLMRANATMKVRPNRASLCKMCTLRDRLAYNARGLIVCSWSMIETPEDTPITKCPYYECVI